MAVVEFVVEGARTPADFFKVAKAQFTSTRS